MSDVASSYTFATPGGTIVFNDGSTDEYYLTDITGLDQADVRNPNDDAPQVSGAIVHTHFETGLRPVLTGIFMIRSTRVMTAIRIIRNEMEKDLTVAVRSILGADGTLAWTPLGQAAASLVVRQEFKVEYTYVDGYLNKQFVFGLVSEAAAPS